MLVPDYAPEQPAHAACACGFELRIDHLDGLREHWAVCPGMTLAEALTAALRRATGVSDATTRSQRGLEVLS